MAKKRVHELAKQYNMPTAEVMKRLNAAGIAVKATASAVDEADADAALTGKKKPSANGAKPKQPPRTQLRPAGDLGIRDLGARPPEGMKPKPKPKPEAGRAGGDGKARRQGRPRRPRAPRSRASARPAPPAACGASSSTRRPPAARAVPAAPAVPAAAPAAARSGARRGAAAGAGAAPTRSRCRRTPRSSQADVIKVNSGSTVKDVAEYLGVAIPEVIKKLMQLGEMATLTQTLTDDAVQVLADEFDKKIEIVHAADEVDAEPEFDDADEDLEPRPPVVTIMGHVDHGKTSLLDAIRETEVAAGEAGGITQHIGAYQVHHGDKLITFLDTPGHEAFTAMRARGAQVTDIAVIVVAADDGVKPQTREAVDHAKAAEVPILVAVNKIDKEGAQPDRVRTEMTTLGLQPEEWGGDTMFVDVSAKAKTNLDDLLESILLLAEVEELKANPEAEASGVVIESKLDPGRGAVVTVLVNRGTLQVGDALVAGAHWGRVRALHDYKGRKVKEATPSEPVEVLGFDTVPEAGEYVRVVENDRKARQLAGERGFRLKSEAQARRSQRTRSLATIFEDARGGKLQDLNLVLKADVSGSLEAFEDEIAKLPQSEVQVQVVLVRRRRHHRVRRHARGGLRRDRDRLQRPPGGRGAPGRRPRGRRDPELLGHLPRDRRAARRHAGHARARGGRGDRRHRRGARDLPRLQGRHDRRLLRHRRQGHARREGAAGARRHDRLRRRDRVAAAQRRTTSARSPPASSAASCCATTPTSRRAT